VGDDDEGLVKFIAQFEKEVVQFFLVVGVEATRRFIGEHHKGIIDQRPGHCYALQLTARQFGRLMIGTCSKGPSSAAAHVPSLPHRSISPYR